MCPAGKCVDKGEELSPPKSFLTRVLQLPSLRHAVTLYNNTKEHQFVGVALQVAEAGVCVAASTALPLASPLVKSMGGWEALDTWACRELDRFEEAAPIITRPTEEVVSRTRAVVLHRLAGVESDGEEQPCEEPPTTLTSALAARANNTMKFVSSTRGGVLLTAAVHRFLNTAHGLLDFYLPPEKADLILDYDGRDGSLRLQVEGLVEKGRRRVKQRVCSLLHVNHSEAINPDDFVITFGHMVELSRRLMTGWYESALQQPYIGRMVQGAGVAGVVVMDAGTAAQASLLSVAANLQNTAVMRLLASVVTTSVARVKQGVGEGSDVAKRSMNAASGALRNGFSVITGVARSGVQRVGSVTKKGEALAGNIAMTGVSALQSAGRSSVHGICLVARTGGEVGYAFLQTVVPVVDGMVTFGVSLTKNVLIVNLVITNTLIRRGVMIVQTTGENTIELTHSAIIFGRQSTQSVASTLKNTASEFYANVALPVLSTGTQICEAVVLRVRCTTEEILMKMANVKQDSLSNPTISTAITSFYTTFSSLITGLFRPFFIPATTETKKTVHQLVKGLHSTPMSCLTPGDSPNQEDIPLNHTVSPNLVNSNSCSDFNVHVSEIQENLTPDSEVCDGAVQGSNSGQPSSTQSDSEDESEYDSSDDGDDDTAPGPLENNLFM